MKTSNVFKNKKGIKKRYRKPCFRKKKTHICILEDALISGIINIKSENN